MASYCCVDAGGKVLARDGDTRTTGGASVFHPDAGSPVCIQGGNAPVCPAPYPGVSCPEGGLPW